jgi:hypothetical protein
MHAPSHPVQIAKTPETTTGAAHRFRRQIRRRARITFRSPALFAPKSVRGTPEKKRKWGVRDTKCRSPPGRITAVSNDLPEVGTYGPPKWRNRGNHKPTIREPSSRRSTSQRQSRSWQRNSPSPVKRKEGRSANAGATGAEKIRRQSNERKNAYEQSNPEHH